MNMKPLAIVAGAGGGLGQALLRYFEQQGMQAIGLNRSAMNHQTDLDIRVCDLSNASVTCATLAEIIKLHGPPKIVIHNPSNLVIQPFHQTTQEDFVNCWQSMVLSAVILSRSVIQPMIRGGGGTFIVSGATASLRGGANFSAFSSAKFALRGLTQSLAREFQPTGIHVIHTILDGIIDTPKSRERHTHEPEKMMATNDIAKVYWQLANQPPSTWTHEIDLRPRSEGF